MSRVGKLAVSVPSSISVVCQNDSVVVSNGASTIPYKLSKGITATFSGGLIKLFCTENGYNVSSFYGMDRSNISNIVVGLSRGFSYSVEIFGVGYKVSHYSSLLVMSLGHSHDIFYVLPHGVSVSVDKSTITFSGVDNGVLGRVVADVCSLRPVEPYKGKGVRVSGRFVVRKDGKKK